MLNRSEEEWWEGETEAGGPRRGSRSSRYRIRSTRIVTVTIIIKVIIKHLLLFTITIPYILGPYSVPGAAPSILILR